MGGGGGCVLASVPVVVCGLRGTWVRLCVSDGGGGMGEMTFEQGSREATARTDWGWGLESRDGRCWILCRGGESWRLVAAAEGTIGESVALPLVSLHLILDRYSMLQYLPTCCCTRRICRCSDETRSHAVHAAGKHSTAHGHSLDQLTAVRA